jgi:predicted lipoprotein
MTRLLTATLCAGLALGLPACKIVKDEPEAQAAIPDGPAGDEARMKALVDETFASDVQPHVAQAAVEYSVLKQAVDAGIDAAGEEYGNRGAGAGAAWAFPVKGGGKVTAANLESRARSADVDIDGDGTADLTVQLGPVFKGTALRDVSPMFVFTDFRDQIEFARLAREMNDRNAPLIVIPEGDLLGRTIGFTGAVSLKDAGDPWLVTPIAVEVRE